LGRGGEWRCGGRRGLRRRLAGGRSHRGLAFGCGAAARFDVAAGGDGGFWSVRQGLGVWAFWSGGCR
jgi:hypothetical protein